MELLSRAELTKVCPVKWHEKIPEDGISLGVADVDFKGPAGVVEYIRKNLKESFSFYQDQSGLEIAITAIKRFFLQKGSTIGKNNIQVIPGTMLGIYAAMKYASRREGKIICLGPIYEPIHRHATDNGNKIDWVTIENHGLNLDELSEKVNASTKMIAICNPTNPIGHVFAEDELKAIRDLAVDYNIPCFSDELYEPLIFSGKHRPLASLDGMEDRTIALYGFSKAYGLAGYRSGFMFLSDSVAEEVKNIINAQLVAPSPIASLIISFALEDPRVKSWVSEFRELMRINTKIASESFRKSGYKCNTPDGCFFIYPKIDVEDIAFSDRLLSNKGIQVIPGSHFGPTGINHIRINCGTSEVRLMKGINGILKELENT